MGDCTGVQLRLPRLTQPGHPSLVRHNEHGDVVLCWAGLVLGWVIILGSTTSVGNLSRSNQLPRSTQPGHPCVGRRSEYRPKGIDALWRGSKGRCVSCLVAGKTV